MLEKRFSESPFWEMHQALYENLGPKVWTHGGMPSYLTTSPFLLKRYAHLIKSQCSIWLQNSSLDFDEPIYIFDVGCGPGRGGYVTLVLLEELFASLPINVKYIFVDVSQEIINFLIDNVDLRSFFASGRADLARFDALKDSEMTLHFSKQILGKNLLKNPMCVIANYFFDSLPHDLFEKENGTLYQVNTSFIPETSEEMSLIKMLRTTVLQTKRGPEIVPEKYYKQSSWTASLSALNQYDWFTDFGIPVGAFEALDNLLSWSSKGYFLIASDQGAASLDNLHRIGGHRASPIAMGSISVNYLALRHYFEAQGKLVKLAYSENDSELVTIMIMEQDCNTMLSSLFENILSDFYVVDFLKLTNHWFAHVPFSLEKMSLLLLCSGHDPCIFFNHFKVIRQALRESSTKEKKAWRKHLLNLAKLFFPVSHKDQQLLGDIGALLFEIGAIEDALRILLRVLALDGGALHTEKNVKLCLKRLGRVEEFDDIKSNIFKI